MLTRLIFSAFVVSFAGSIFGQVAEKPMSSAIDISENYLAVSNIVYVTDGNYDAKLDLYRPAGHPSPTPVVVLIHGGGWVNGNKEEIVFSALPYMEMGFAVINIEYRLARVAKAPGAVEDCLCALHWLGRNAKNYNLDLNKVIVTGASAGGHLALTTAMIPTSAGFETQCANDDDPSGGGGPWTNARPKVVAVVNWFGITDVVDMLHGANMRAYAVTWMGTPANRDELAKQLSPLTYVRSDLPAILTIHGDQDNYVPYSQAVRLHAALDKAGVKNQLLTIPGRGHGNFDATQDRHAWETIKTFLSSVGINPVTK